jgi:uncharacterized OB-fold protein
MTGPLKLYADAVPGPGPVVHPETEPFWRRLAERQTFSIARCTTCGATRYPLAPACPVCLGFGHEWVDVAPEGSVSAAVRVVRATGIAGWRTATPYIAALVDLALGVRVPGRVLCDCGGALVHGTPVRMCLVPTAEGGVVHAYVHACRADEQERP